jgi:hypothetical protein
MVYISRKIIYPSFVVIFSLVFFILLYFFYFSDGLEVSEESIEIVGQSIIYRSIVTNTSMHYVRDVKVDIIDEEFNNSYRIKDLAPGESVDVEIDNIPIVNDYQYDLVISGFLNRPKRFEFSLEASTVRPVDAEVNLASEMQVGTEYNYFVKLCNVSNNALTDVMWSESIEGSYFEQPLIPRTIDLSVNECKNLNSTLTPIREGDIVLDLRLRVGKVEQNYEYNISIDK